MTAEILDGKRHADAILEEVKANIDKIVANGKRAPALAVILVGDDPASQRYVRNKFLACERVGIKLSEYKLGADASQAALDHIIDSLNADESLDGILVQLPLPKHMDAKSVPSRINPAKDVDGLHPYNQGLLLQGVKGLRPCTPCAVMHMLKDYGVVIKGAHAVVIGRSDIVGKPMAHMLLEEHATVTIAHSQTRNLPTICREADILVAAVGRPGIVEGHWIKPGAVVIDVGINEVAYELEAARIMSNEPKKLEILRTKGRVLYGDVRFGEALQTAGAITPVPGGVGLLTVAGLMMNTLYAYNTRNND